MLTLACLLLILSLAIQNTSYTQSSRRTTLVITQLRLLVKYLVTVVDCNFLVYLWSTKTHVAVMRKMVSCKARHRQPGALYHWRNASRVAVTHWPPHMSVRVSGQWRHRACHAQPLPAWWRQKQVSGSSFFSNSGVSVRSFRSDLISEHV